MWMKLLKNSDVGTSLSVTVPAIMTDLSAPFVAISFHRGGMARMIRSEMTGNGNH